MQSSSETWRRCFTRLPSSCMRISWLGLAGYHAREPPSQEMAFNSTWYTGHAPGCRRQTSKMTKLASRPTLIGGHRHSDPPSLHQQGPSDASHPQSADWAAFGREESCGFVCTSQGGRVEPEMPRSNSMPGPKAISRQSWPPAGQG